MIEAVDLTKKFGKKVAVDHVTFTVKPGIVTGFLGPNGAGKSTTMRMILGLDRPSAGSVTVAGRPYAKLAAPYKEIGALIDAKGVHPRRSARSHLRTLAATHGISNKRVDEVMELTGIAEVSKKSAGKFSLGMGQRLGIAGALLADPEIVMFDEPVNGLDPDGVLWVRQLSKYLAQRGRTVFLSSHLMSEVQQTADHIIVIGKGKILADSPLKEFMKSHAREGVLVTSPDAARLAELVAAQGGMATVLDHRESLAVTGIGALGIGRIARDNSLLLAELREETTSLEEAYMALTSDQTEFKSGAITSPEAAAAVMASPTVPTTTEGGLK